MALRILMVLLILAVPLELPGCGPFLPEAIFHTTSAPESPADFARGRLGILQPSYERIYQVIAYRYLAGIGLNDAEQQAAVATQPDLPPAYAPSPDIPVPDHFSNPWLEARNHVPGITPVRFVDPYRRVQRQGYFDEYLNCNDDAFRTAAATLERIRKTTGSADWIAAQDEVFADCSQGAAIPQPTADPQLAPDRAYQIACARFYAEQYEAARQDFQTIAADSSSPWRGIAPYLAARCSIRAGKFAEAETELRQIAADPASGRWQASAQGLLGYVQARLHPPARMHELAIAIVRRDAQATLGQNLIDYRRLFDQNIEPQPADDLTDWIVSFQAGGAGALEKWRDRRTLPWLLAALQSAHPRDTGLADLLAAAADVPADSPGYLTVSFLRLRLLPADESRTLADAVLAGEVPAAARNQLRAARMGLARDFGDFLHYVARQPVATMSEQLDPVSKGQDFLDEDAANAFNRDMPVNLLRQAASGTTLPDAIRHNLQRVLPVRELVLSAAPPFDGVFALLKTPGDQPFVASGYGRFTPEPDNIDDFRDNWWCAPGGNPAIVSPPAPDPGLPFLSPADRAQADAEYRKLSAAGDAPDWMGAQVLAFAQAHPQDPRLPEALYLVVHATRFGCTDAQTGDISKRAFDLLHRRFPNSEWARKTPYWFK